jgi:proton-coupled amino acid transporter
MPAPGGPGSGTRTPASGYENPFEELTEEEKVRILRRHLVSREQREQQLDRKSSFGSLTDRGEGPSKSKWQPPNPGRDQVTGEESSEPFPIPYHTPGADLTHNIYKWQADQRRGTRPRSASFAGSTRSSVNPAFANIHQPGGFRRNYLLMRAHEQGEEDPQMVSSFIEFLYLFGHFVNTNLLAFRVLSNGPFSRPVKIWKKSKRRMKKFSKMRRRGCEGPLPRRKLDYHCLFSLNPTPPNPTMRRHP